MHEAVAVNKVACLLLHSQRFRHRIDAPYRPAALLHLVLDCADYLLDGEITKYASDVRIWQPVRLLISLVELDEYKRTVAGAQAAILDCRKLHAGPRRLAVAISE